MSLGQNIEKKTRGTGVHAGRSQQPDRVFQALPFHDRNGQGEESAERRGADQARKDARIQNGHAALTLGHVEGLPSDIREEWEAVHSEKPEMA